MEPIVVETIESLQEYLPNLIRGCRNAAEDFQVGNEANGLELVPLLTEGLSWVLEAVVGLQKLGRATNLVVDELTQHFEQMSEALSIKDYVLLADLLEYEIITVLEGWLEKLNPTH